MCPVMIRTIYFEADHKKLVSSQKSSIFGPQKGHFVQSGPRNGPPSGQTATYQKTKGIQSSLRIWRSCHPIESGPSEPKKWGFHRCSVKKRRISGKKCSFLARNPFFLEIVQLYLSPPWPDTKKTTFFCWLLCTGVQKIWAPRMVAAGHMVFCINMFRYIYITSSLGIKHRKNCECCPVSHLIVR